MTNDSHTTCRRLWTRYERLQLNIARDTERLDAHNARIRRVDIDIADAENALRQLDGGPPSLPNLPGPVDRDDRDNGKRPKDSLLDALVDIGGAAVSPVLDRLERNRLNNQLRILNRERARLFAERRPVVQLRNDTIAAHSEVLRQMGEQGCPGA